MLPVDQKKWRISEMLEKAKRLDGKDSERPVVEFFAAAAAGIRRVLRDRRILLVSSEAISSDRLPERPCAPD